MDSKDSESIQVFLKENYGDSISLLSKPNYEQVKRPLLVFLHYFKILKCEKLKQWTDKLFEISVHFPETIKFTIMDYEDASLFHLNWNELDEFECDASSQPYVFAIDADEHQHDLDEEFTTCGLRNFCEYLEKNKEYYTDPMDEIEQDPDINVCIITADNFRQLVEQNDKDVFLTLHSKYSFKYELNLWGVPRELKTDSDKLVFYGINAYTNYIPLEYRVKELPTSLFIPRSNKNKRLVYHNKYFDGKDIIRFIAKNATTELKHIDRNGFYKRDNDDDDFYSKAKRIHDVLERFDAVIENVSTKSQADDDGFFELLNSILGKVNAVKRNEIEMELVSFVLKRLNKV